MGKVEFTDNSAKFLAKLQREVDRAVGASSDELAQTIQNQMPGQGAAVVDGTGGDTGIRAKYIPSNPGSAPGIRTNRLKGSIAAVKRKSMSWSVGDNKIPAPVGKAIGPVKYAKHLEFATSKMPARPFMRPGLDAAKKPMLRVFINTLKRGMK